MHTHANHDVSDKARSGGEDHEQVIPTPKTVLDTEP